MPIRTLIVDDHRPFRRALREYLAAIAAVEVVGEAGDGAEARIKQSNPATTVMLYSFASPGPRGRPPGLTGGICLAKDRLFEELPDLIQRMCRVQEDP